MMCQANSFVQGAGNIIPHIKCRIIINQCAGIKSHFSILFDQNACVNTYL